MPVRHQPDFNTFAQACQVLGVNLTPAIYQSLQQYACLIEEWNKKINLVSRKDIDRILTYHIIDSLAACRFIPHGARCADIGSGAGLPGIPLAIVRPDINMTLIESIKKKCRFLEAAVSELGLKNTELIAGRAEALSPLGCDILLSRLTSALDRTLRYCRFHLKPGGLLILYKSLNWEAELKSAAKIIDRFNLRWLRTESISLPFTEITRHFVIITT
ncbi:MAG: 16S rRNA (guanine(527)-N(7))-methyltransferase RsmG [candidate division WOR-3 bacterium]